MSKLFDRLTEFGSEVGAELGRMGKQGAAELAHALFSGSAYVPYGDGQNSPSPEIEKPGQEQSMEGLQRESGGMER